MRKNVASDFLKNPYLAKHCLKLALLAQKSEVFHLFPNPFGIFCMKPSLCSRKGGLEKIKILAPLNSPNLVISGLIHRHFNIFGLSAVTDGPLDSPLFALTNIHDNFPQNLRIGIFYFLYWKISKNKWRFCFFSEFSEMAPFLPKNDHKLAFLPQNVKKGEFFALYYFFKTAHWNFLIFCRKSILCSRKNDCFGLSGC